PLEGAESRVRMFDAIARILLRAAKNAPLAILIDDLHWADASSLSLLEFLAREIRRTGALVVCTYRDQALATNERLEHAVGAILREFASGATRLEGLSAAQIGSFVGSKLGKAPGEETTKALAQRTGGNPLFLAHLVELMRTQKDTVGEWDLAALRIPS